MFVWHNDEVRSGHPDMTILASSDACPNQIWRYRDRPVWGIQGHPEVTPESARGWLEARRERLVRDGADVDALIAEARDVGNAETLFDNFIASSADSMPRKDLWFAAAEYRARVRAARERLRERGLDGLLAFQAESVTWLTGYFTRAYGGFQLALLPLDRDPIVVCRDQSAFYLRLRSPFEECVVWRDGDDPVRVGCGAIADTFGAGARLAIEMNSWHLTAARFAALRDALPAMHFEDAGDLVAGLRLVESPAELELQRRAGKAAEAGDGRRRRGGPAGGAGARRGGGGVRGHGPGGKRRAGTGRSRLRYARAHLHGGYGDRVLRPGDTLQLEVTPTCASTTPASCAPSRWSGRRGRSGTRPMPCSQSRTVRSRR